MKCYQIHQGVMDEFIYSNVIPCTPSLLKTFRNGQIKEAEAVLDAITRPQLDILKICKRSMHEGTAFCRIRFNTVPKAPKNAKQSDKILVAYHPAEYMLSRLKGDQSDIIYRSVNCFVIVTTKFKLALVAIDTNNSEQYSYDGVNLIKGTITTAVELPDDKEETRLIITIN